LRRPNAAVLNGYSVIDDSLFDDLRFGARDQLGQSHADFVREIEVPGYAPGTVEWYRSSMEWLRRSDAYRRPRTFGGYGWLGDIEGRAGEDVDLEEEDGFGDVEEEGEEVGVAYVDGMEELRRLMDSRTADDWEELRVGLLDAIRDMDANGAQNDGSAAPVNDQQQQQQQENDGHDQGIGLGHTASREEDDPQAQNGGGKGSDFERGQNQHHVSDQRRNAPRTTETALETRWRREREANTREMEESGELVTVGATSDDNDNDSLF
jgi:hypothetical protein